MNKGRYHIIQGGDDVQHPLDSVVLVPGYHTPVKLNTLACRYKDPYIPQIDALKAS
jgi:hypothetical protein